MLAGEDLSGGSGDEGERGGGGERATLTPLLPFVCSASLLLLLWPLAYLVACPDPPSTPLCGCANCFLACVCRLAAAGGAGGARGAARGGGGGAGPRRGPSRRPGCVPVPGAAAAAALHARLRAPRLALIPCIMGWPGASDRLADWLTGLTDARHCRLALLQR